MNPSASTAPPVRLAILDDHELLLDSMTSWIAAHSPDFDLVLTASTWFGLIQSEQFPTDLVLLDFQLQESVSIEARVRTCRAAGAKVIVLSSLDTADDRDRAYGAGASAFLSKAMGLAEVMDTARAVMGYDSGTALPDRPGPGPGPRTGVTRPSLSESEREALVLYASGLSTAEVAREMSVQYETAKTFLRRVRDKYARAGRPASAKTDLIRRAAEDGHLR